MTITAEFDIGKNTDKGRRRTDNQDNAARVEEFDRYAEARKTYGRLYIVADGVGGNDKGDRASEMTVKGVMDHYYDPQNPHQTDLKLRLEYAIEQTTNEIFAEAVRDSNNMASTIVAAVIHDGQLIVSNVGDSPAFLIRENQKVEKLTTDHVMVRGQKSGLSQSMGDREVSVSTRQVSFSSGDAVVLCTDGLTDLVQPDEIKREVMSNSADGATRSLIGMANQRGGHDNITVLVVRLGHVPVWKQKRTQNMLAYAMGGAVVLALFIGLFLFLMNPGDQTSERTTAQQPEFTGSSGDAIQLAPTSTIQSTSTPLPTPTPAPATSTPLPLPTPLPGQPDLRPTPIPTRRPATGPQQNQQPASPGGGAPAPAPAAPPTEPPPPPNWLPCQMWWGPGWMEPERL